MKKRHNRFVVKFFMRPLNSVFLPRLHSRVVVWGAAVVITSVSPPWVHKGTSAWGEMDTNDSYTESKNVTYGVTMDDDTAGYAIRLSGWASNICLNRSMLLA